MLQPILPLTLPKIIFENRYPLNPSMLQLIINGDCNYSIKAQLFTRIDERDGEANRLD